MYTICINIYIYIYIIGIHCYDITYYTRIHVTGTRRGSCPGARALNGPDVIPVGHRGHHGRLYRVARDQWLTVTGHDSKGSARGDGRQFKSLHRATTLFQRLLSDRFYYIIVMRYGQCKTDIIQSGTR
jgi:hypothetical protein